MNFLTDIYSKVVGPKKKESSDGSKDFTEDFDKEDGFVLYTAAESKRYKQADFNPKDNSAISYEVFQRSSLSQYPCAASTSRMDIATRVPQGKLFPNRHTTFLTVSDIPMQLSKPFQLAQQMNQNSSEASRKSPPNVEHYHYDFTLERNVLHGH